MKNLELSHTSTIVAGWTFSFINCPLLSPLAAVCRNSLPSLIASHFGFIFFYCSTTTVGGAIISKIIYMKM